MKFVFVVLAVMVAQTYCYQSKLIKLAVYYESLCPDSKRFIVQQLIPATSTFQDYMELQLVPFGKAKSIGEGKFNCQHGPPECLGNLVQDCALNFMTKRSMSDVDKVKYIACEMETKAGTTGNLKCVKQAGLQDNKVQECIKSNSGIQLQMESERLTNNVTPKFIPTITYNGIFDQNFQDDGMSDLVTTICRMLPFVNSCAARISHSNPIQG